MRVIHGDAPISKVRGARTGDGFLVLPRIRHVFDSVGESAESRDSVPLADVSGKVVSAVQLADGVEVRVLEWRPRGTNETRYRVQAPHGVDGWLPAENLRSALVAVPRDESASPPRATTVADVGGRRFGQPADPASPPRATTVADSGTRRFGQQVHPEHASDPVKSEYVRPGSDAGGRRFGQH